MNPLVSLLARQGIAALGAFLAAHNIAGNDTVSLALGVSIAAFAWAWSWIAKCLKIDEAKGGEMLRVLLGAAISQGVTFLSVYFAVDANNPELLLGAVINAAASKAGLHQRLAFLGVKDAVKVLALCSLLSALCSCSTSQKQDALTFGKRVAISAADAAVMIAEIRLEEKRAELKAAIDAGAPLEETALKAAAFQAARDALDKARAALAAEAAKLDAKAPREVTPSAPIGELIGKEQAAAFQVPGSKFYARENRYSSEPHKLASGGSTPPPDTNLPRGLCLGTPASCKPSQPSCIACHAPQAGRLATMRGGDAAPLRIPLYGHAVAAHLSTR